VPNKKLTSASSVMVALASCNLYKGAPMPQGPVLSVVDYAAWEKGYMPPSEHVLIDKLAYRGAKVVMSFSVGSKEQVWIVFEGVKLTSAKRKLMLKIMGLWFDADEEDDPKPPQRYTIVMDGPSRFVLADNESDEPASVYETAELAQAALAERLAQTE